MRTNLALALTLAVALLTAGCEREPAPSGPTQATGSSGVTINASGTVPPTGPPGAIVRIVAGDAAVELSGSLHGSLSLNSLGEPTIYTLPPGATALQWGTAEGDGFSIGGTSFTGERRTSSTLRLTITVDEGSHVLSLSSIGGECTVRVTEATEARFAGTFGCSGLSDGTVGATGSFEATG